MRIVIDLQGAQTESRFRGIGRYSLSLAKAIVRNRGDNEVLLVLSSLFPETIESIRAEFVNLLPQKNIRVWYALGPVSHNTLNNDWRRKIAELIREAFLLSLGPDVIYITSLFEGYVDDAISSIGTYDKETPVAVSLYDLIPLLNPDQYLKPNKNYKEYYLQKITHLKKAEILLAISDSSRLEGLENLQLFEDKIVNISTATSDEFCQKTLNDKDKEILFSKFEINRQFILYSGGADERKNLLRLIEAYSKLSEKLKAGYQLVFSGRIPKGNEYALNQKARQSGLSRDQLIFTGYVSDDELIQLYNLCELFVFPSFHEGFGLPALEAMKCGAPVIGANLTSIPEVIGTKEAMFDPYSIEGIKDKITQALKDDSFRALLIKNGLSQAKKFSWDKSAKLAVSAFESIHAKSNKSVSSKSYKSLVSEISQFIPQDISSRELAIIADSISCTIGFDEDSKPNLFVDISELFQRDAKTGVQRVTRSIVSELLKSPPKEYNVVLVYGMHDGSGYRCANSYTAKLLNRELGDDDDGLIEYQAGDIFLGLDLQHQVTCANQKYLTRFKQDGVKVIFVIYDLLPILMPHFFPSGTDTNHKNWLKVISTFDGAICISEAVENELNEWLKINVSERERPFYTNWFHLGADIKSSMPSLGLNADTKKVLIELKSRSTFLTVGTIEPRKGQSLLLKACEELWDRGVNVNLVMVGKKGWHVDSLISKIQSHKELGSRLFWLNSISDEYLEKIYGASTCLVASSEGEGFGLPLIEAGQHKLPIIARDIPVFREVAGAHAYYYNGNKPSDLADSIAHWLELYEINRHPMSNTMPWRTWEESASQLLAKIGITNL